MTPSNDGQIKYFFIWYHYFDILVFLPAGLGCFWCHDLAIHWHSSASLVLQQEKVWLSKDQEELKCINGTQPDQGSNCKWVRGGVLLQGGGLRMFWMSYPYWGYNGQWFNLFLKDVGLSSSDEFCLSLGMKRYKVGGSTVTSIWARVSFVTACWTEKMNRSSWSTRGCFVKINVGFYKDITCCASLCVGVMTLFTFSE